MSLAAVLALNTIVEAQTDRVYPLTGSAISGTVAKTSAQGVQLKKGSGTQSFMAGEIKKILYDGDPAALTKGREFAIDGQYDQALENLAGMDLDSLPRAVIKADAVFYRAMCSGKLALAGKKDKKAAAVEMLSFASKYRDSWHFYDAAKILGDLALALGNTDDALKFYGSLRSAPSATAKIDSVYLTGMAQMRAGDIATAIAQFDKVIGLKVDSVSAARLQSLAKAGKATAFAIENKPDEGLELVSALIADMGPTDIEMAARTYNAQGANYEAKGDAEGALLAYLHTHLMFSSQSDSHAVALSKLVELWPKVGKPERGAEAKQELKQLYPGFGQ
ncbi:hypothetical protein CA13_44660 [Planctomycetes bacterium CA13]|uniref:Tetratricopeptide repeat protein n=2 Tax=Novipirellula herctigrandis TaxID=2527986 RepID=A0A5C5Z8Z1_9BACT|nr:hypothetical protein CA13_44660 [Planctomycetes bacterium CA13]